VADPDHLMIFGSNSLTAEPMVPDAPTITIFISVTPRLDVLILVQQKKRKSA